MSEILRGRNFVVRWHDPEHTTIVLEVLDRWTWDDAYYAIKYSSQIIAATPHEVYSIIWFKFDMPRFPDGVVLPRLQELVLMGPSNERLVVFITNNTVLQTFLQLANRIYKLRDYLVKYRFVSTLEHALKIIEKHKQSPVG